LSSPRRAVIWGASGHASVVANAARLSGAWELLGFIDEVSPERAGEAFAGGVVLGGKAALESSKAAGVTHVLLGVGDNVARWRIAQTAEELGFALGTVVHPAAVVADDVVLGAGTFVGPGAIINPAARVGRAGIINTNAVVEHHCELGEAVHVAPGAILGGAVRVGRLTWVGLGALVKEKLSIGEETLLGAGAVVVRDVGSRVVAYGIPAVKQRGVD
jgi:UDP-N-acetylbacillosamine N-acetyltransferase